MEAAGLVRVRFHRLMFGTMAVHVGERPLEG
jgi:ubiquinone/menaquinone biosynthesis C-methylase UbiE